MALKLALPYIAGAIAAIGTIASAGAQAQTLKSQQAAEQYNAAVLKEQAIQNDALTEQKIFMVRRENAAHTGNLIATLGQTGVSLTTGSASDLIADSDLNASFNLLNTVYTGQSQSSSLRSGSTLSSSKAKSYGQSATNATFGGIFSAAGTGFNTYNIADSYVNK